MNGQHKKKTLFLLNKSNDEAMRLAKDYVRELGVRILNQQGSSALIALATKAQVEAASESGLFATISSQAISEAYLKAYAPEHLQAARIWNALKSPEFHELSKDRSEKGKSWADPEKDPFPPQTVTDPEDLKTAVLEYLQVDEEAFLGQYADGKPRELEGEQFAAYERLLAEIHDPTVAYHVARLVYHLEFPYRDIVLELPTEFFYDFFQEAACWRMQSEISVGVVFVESSLNGGPRFSSSERSTLEAEIVTGLDFLASEAPDAANLTWVCNWQYVTINVANGDDESYESYWRNPAMGQVNYFGNTYSADRDGMDAYREEMRDRNRSAHAFVIFVTPYANDRHAYAGGGRATLANRNNWGNWGIQEIDRITAHEVCHLFGAADEYTGDTGTPCSSCVSTHGCFNIPNGNCGECARPQQKCLMGGNHRRICAYTQGQIGWSDLFVDLTTANVKNAGTDDTVWLDIGDRTFELDTPNHDDRERDHVEGYALNYTGVNKAQVKRVGIRKSSDGSYGGWRLYRVRLWVRGELICDQSSINQWLEDEYLWWASFSCGSSTDIVNRLEVRVTTADVGNAGTDDDVTLYLDGASFDLDNQGHDDFERGNTDTFHVDPGTGLYESSISAIQIHKAPDGSYGGWRLKGLQILVNGATIYNNQSINKWLKDSDRDWFGSI